MAAIAVIRAAISTQATNGRYWGHSRHWSPLGLNASVVNDPQRTWRVHRSTSAVVHAVPESTSGCWRGLKWKGLGGRYKIQQIL